MKTRVTVVGVLLLVGSFAFAADWPQYGGPHRDGVSPETGLLKQWPKGGPALAWSFKNAGLGFSSMAIVKGTVYTLGSRGDDEIVLALDAASGKELWTNRLGPLVNAPENKQWGDGPRSTPTIDGKHLYALGSQAELVCLDISGAKPAEVWRKNLVKNLDGELMSGWGYSESPLVDGKLLIVTPGGAKGTLAALDKLTGAVVWRSTGLKQMAPYTSVLAADINGEHQYIQSSYAGETEGSYLSGFAAKDGKVLWSARTFKGFEYLDASDPVIQGNLVYQSIGDEAKICHLFEIGKDYQVKDLYSKTAQKKMKNNHGGVVLVGSNVYGYSDNQGWVCQDFRTGKLQPWADRTELEASGSGTLIAADGMLYLYTDKGEVGLAKADPKAFELAGRFTIPELSKFPRTRKTSVGARVWSHPALAEGRLYVRDCEFVYCYKIK